MLGLPIFAHSDCLLLVGAVDAEGAVGAAAGLAAAWRRVSDSVGDLAWLAVSAGASRFASSASIILSAVDLHATQTHISSEHKDAHAHNPINNSILSTRD